MKQKWQIKIARSLGDGFAGTFYDAWGVVKYSDPEAPTVFAGMYGLPDYCNFRSHRGKKMIWWAGSDLRHFSEGWWIDDKGKQRVNPKDFVPYLKKFENWVENTVEADLLKKLGIKAKVCPSFLGDVKDFPKLNKFIKNSYYSSVSGDDFLLYGWDKIGDIAWKNPDVDYYLYGSSFKQGFLMKELNAFPDNVHIMGRVSREEMNRQTKLMTGAIRMVEFEGFSEIIAKSILWGQKPISLIPYKYNRETLLKCVNRYPWNSKK